MQHQVQAYYDQTWLDYRFLWMNGRNRAIHFGYWDAATRTHAQSLLDANRVLAEAIGIQRGMRVLDAGCGVGGSGIWLARQYGVAVVGITPVPSQVERAIRYARQQGVKGRVTFQVQDYAATTFSPRSFDAVWAQESVCHAPDKAAFLAEARRLLRPGGRLGVAEYFRAARPLASAGERLLHSWLSGWAIPDLATVPEFHAWAAEAGFADIHYQDVTPRMTPSLRHLYRLSLLCWPLAVLLRSLRLRSATQHGNIRGARDQYRALRQGLWRYGIVTATAR